MSNTRMGRNPFEKSGMAAKKRAGSDASAGAKKSGTGRSRSKSAQAPAGAEALGAAQIPTPQMITRENAQGGRVSRLARWALVEAPAEGFVLGLKAVLLVRARIKSGRSG